MSLSRQTSSQDEQAETDPTGWRRHRDILPYSLELLMMVFRLGVVLTRCGDLSFYRHRSSSREEPQKIESKL
jgi:hypothetical protein